MVITMANISSGLFDLILYVPSTISYTGGGGGGGGLPGMNQY